MARSKPAASPGPVQPCGGRVGKTNSSAPHTPPSPPFNQDSPPPHLRPETASWWRAVVGAFELEHHHLRLLRLACEAWDRGQEARESLAQHGSVFVDRFGQPRARPEIAIERDSRISFARMLRELALDVEGPAEDGRPPRIGGNAGRKAPEVSAEEMAEFERLFCH